MVGEGILITISDLTAATGVVAADFTGLNLYRSTDAVLDGGDTFLKTVATVNIGAITTVDFQGVGNPSKTMPDPGDVPDRIFFLITADIAALPEALSDVLRFGGPASGYCDGCRLDPAARCSLENKELNQRIEFVVVD